MKIGELARRTESNIETIRYYERVALLPPPARTEGRFRLYDGDDVARLRFIRRARQLGFTLDEVRAFIRLAAASGGNDACIEARRLGAAHVREIRAKISDLQAMVRVLSDAIRECEAGRQPRCPLIEVLSREGVGPRLMPKGRQGQKRPAETVPAAEGAPKRHGH